MDYDARRHLRSRGRQGSLPAGAEVNSAQLCILFQSNALHCAIMGSSDQPWHAHMPAVWLRTLMP